MKKETKKVLEKGGALSAVMLGVTVMLVLSFTTNPTEILSSVGEKGWTNIASAGTPPAGESGVYFIYVYPHQAAPGTAYAVNLSNASAYAYGSLNSTLTGSVPSSTAFDLVVKCRDNATHAYNKTGATWMNSWIRANMTCAGLRIGAYTPMTLRNIANGSSSSYMWVHYYLNNGGAGYTISHGQSINATLFSM